MDVCGCLCQCRMWYGVFRRAEKIEWLRDPGVSFKFGDHRAAAKNVI